MNRPLLQIALDNLTLEDAIASLKTGVDEVVDIIECGTILIGNGLYEALLSMGAETADCYVKAGLSEKEKKKLRNMSMRRIVFYLLGRDIY